MMEPQFDFTPESGWVNENVPLHMLRVDRTYQREVNQAFVRKCAKAFQPDALGQITLSLRDDGYYYVIDGQQRAELCRTVLGPTATIFARSKTGLTVENEAQLFQLLDTKFTMSVDDKFRAYLAAGDPDITALNAIATKHGWVPGSGKRAGPRYGIIRGCGWAFQTIAKHKHRAAPDTDEVMGLLAMAWPDRPVMPSSLLDGILLFHARYRGVYDPKRLIVVLGAASPESWRLRAKQSPGSGAREQVINCIAQAYNYRLQGRRLEIRI